MRGATAAVNGSPKWASRGPSHRGAGTQSESTKATIDVRAARRPALRAAAGPTFEASPTKVAPCRAATSSVAAGSPEASSTTTTAPTPPSAPSRRSSWAGRSRTGTTTVTSCSPGDSSVPSRSGRGCATKAPDDTRRRASAPFDGRSPTSPPDDQRSTSERARGREPEEPDGAATQDDRAAVEARRGRVGAQGKGAGQRRVAARRGGSKRRGSGVTGGVHSPILLGCGRWDRTGLLGGRR